MLTLSEPINDLETIIENIRCYLGLNPNAADTLDGVMKWWLSNGLRNVSKESVQEGLEFLLKQGVIKRSKSIDGKEIYSSSL